MRLSIVGTGYVGLVSAVCFAEHGHDVVCVDVDPERIDRINRAEAPMHEVGLVDLLRRHVPSRVRATKDLDAAISSSDLTFLCVGTPSAEGRIDLRQVEEAVTRVGEAIRHKRDRHTLVVKSTVLPGTTQNFVKTRLESASGRVVGATLGLAMNPEFLTEGTAIVDAMRPDRLVFGCVDQQSAIELRELYRGFPETIPRIVSNATTAEMIKYASNALLATMISFSNELARFCTALGDVDALDVVKGVHESVYLTTRTATGSITAPLAAFLEAGCGFGGSCLPKDTSALIARGRDLGLPMPLLNSVLEINSGQAEEMLRLARRQFETLDGLRISVLGLAFKPGTDDVRESPAWRLLDLLVGHDVSVRVYDPVVRAVPQRYAAHVHVEDALEAALDSTDLVFIVTRWPEFERLPAIIAASERAPLVVDGRRMLPVDSVPRYAGIGR